MSFVFTHNPKGFALPAPSVWWHTTDTETGKRTIWARCPNGHIAALNHEIAADGAVTPRVDCPDDGCGFHTFVRLEGWEG
jgi:hypothetical protein